MLGKVPTVVPSSSTVPNGLYTLHTLLVMQGIGLECISYELISPLRFPRLFRFGRVFRRWNPPEGFILSDKLEILPPWLSLL